MKYFAYVIMGLAFGALPVAYAGDFSPSCAETSSKEFYRPADAGFEEMIARYNGMMSKSDVSIFSNRALQSLKLNINDTAYISIGIASSSCVVASGGAEARAKYDCNYAGCNEEIPETSHLPPGSKITMQTCTISTRVQTVTVWTKQPNGSWTVTTRTEEVLVEGCPPIE